MIILPKFPCLRALLQNIHRLHIQPILNKISNFKNLAQWRHYPWSIFPGSWYPFCAASPRDCVLWCQQLTPMTFWRKLSSNHQICCLCSWKCLGIHRSTDWLKMKYESSWHSGQDSFWRQFREFFCESTLRTRLKVHRGLAPSHSLSCFTLLLTSFPWDFVLKKLTIPASLT